MSIRDNITIHQNFLFHETPKNKIPSGVEIAVDNFGNPAYTIDNAINTLINHNFGFLNPCADKINKKGRDLSPPFFIPISVKS